MKICAYMVPLLTMGIALCVMGLGPKFVTPQKMTWNLFASDATISSPLWYAYTVESCNSNPNRPVNGDQGNDPSRHVNDDDGSDDEEDSDKVRGIDYCTDDICVKLYEEYSGGEKGSAGAFLLLDREYTKRRKLKNRH